MISKVSKLISSQMPNNTSEIRKIKISQHFLLDSLLMKLLAEL